MHTAVKLITLSLLTTLPGLSLAHVQHTQNERLLQRLLHPFTGFAHVLGFLLLAYIISMVKRLRAYPVQTGMFCILLLPVLLSDTMTNSIILSMNLISLSLLVFLKICYAAPAQRKT